MGAEFVGGPQAGRGTKLETPASSAAPVSRPPSPTIERISPSKGRAVVPEDGDPDGAPRRAPAEVGSAIQRRRSQNGTRYPQGTIGPRRTSSTATERPLAPYDESVPNVLRACEHVGVALHPPGGIVKLLDIQPEALRCLVAQDAEHVLEVYLALFGKW